MTTDPVPAHDDVTALIVEARDSMRDARWMPASLAIRMADALEHLSSLLATARADGEARIAAYRKVVFDPISDYYGEIREKFDAIDRAAAPPRPTSNPAQPPDSPHAPV